MLRAIALTLIVATLVIYLVHRHQQDWQVQVCVASLSGGDPSCLNDGDSLSQGSLAVAYVVAHNDAGDGFPANVLQMKINVLDASGAIAPKGGNAVLPVPAGITESRHSWPLTQIFSTGAVRLLSGQTYKIELDSTIASPPTVMGSTTFQMQ